MNGVNRAKMWFSVCSLLSLVASASAVSRPPGIFNQPVKNIYYKAGETVTMPCEATGEPNPSYRWRRNEIDFNPAGNDVRIVQLANVGTLVINLPEDKDEGIYQCLAFNDFGTSASITINLREARLMKFSNAKPQYHKPQLGQPYTLNCVPPESVPPPSVFWVNKLEFGGMEVINYDARVSMDREYRLRFAHITQEDRKDGQAYACMALNNIMRDNSQGKLHFIEPQGLKELNAVEYLWADQSDRFGLQGDTFNVKCIFSGNPTPDVHWERTDNKTMTSRHQLKSFAQELVIVDLQPEDEGRYECWATNTVSSKRKIRTFSIRVQSRPYFIKEPEDLELGVGGTAVFECMAAGNPNPRITWYVNSIPYDNLKDERFVGRLKKQSATKLFLENVVQTDYMVVQCNASNLHGYAFADVYLNVLQEAPTILKPPEKLKRAAEGTPTNLTCEVAGKPDPVITWFRNGEQITGGRYEIQPKGDLFISRVVLADAGLYRCHAKNIFNETFAEGKLVVRRKTRVEKRPGDLEVNAGNSGKLTCSGTTDPEEVHNLRIVWYKDGKQITANDQRMTKNYQDNSLTISGTIVRDSGTYTCEATNGLDSAKAAAVLTIKDRPDAPTNVYHEYCNKNATLHWMPGSYNNAPIQYFVVQYNTSFNPDKWHFGLKVNATLTKINITLSPWVRYTFRVIAYNKIGPSEPSFHSPIECVTKDDRPYFNPRNLRTRGHQPGKLWIEWTPIPMLQQNAPGFSYSLEVLRDGDNDNTLQIYTINDWTEDHYEIATGRVYEKYKITIKARNDIGEASEDATTITGYSYESYPIISPSNFELTSVSDTSATFTWSFPRSEIDKVNTRIRGQFQGFRIQFWEENNKMYTLREEDISPDSGFEPNEDEDDRRKRQAGDMFTAQINNMLPNSRMEAHISVMNNFYTGIPSDPVKFKTAAGFPGPVPYLRPINIGDTHVNLEWAAPLESRGDIEGYDISYRTVQGLDLGEMQEREPQINDPFATNSYLSGLKYKMRYRVFVYARTAKGRGDSYFIEIVTKAPGKPRMPSFNIASVGRHNINVTWWVNAYADTGTVVYVEYKKENGAEWLRTTDEVVHTWKNIENLEAGVTYEMRLMTTNGKKTKASGIEVITTDGTALAYDLVGNIGWFLAMLFSVLLIIALVVLFVLCYKRGFRLGDGKAPYSAPYSGTYDNTVGVAQDNDNFGPEPAGYNNEYYDRRDYDDNGGFEKRPPSYSSKDGRDNYNSKGEYEPYDDRQGGDYDGRDYRDDRGDYPDNYYDDRQQGGYDRQDNYDQRGDYYNKDNRGDQAYDDGRYGNQYDDYDRRDDGYDRRDDYYDRSDDYENRRDDYENRRDDYDRRDYYDDKRDDYRDKRDYEDARVRTKPSKPSAPPSDVSDGKASSTFV